MRTLISLLLCAVLPCVSCTVYQSESHNGEKWARQTIVKLGGKVMHQGSDGSSFSSDDEVSFEQFCQMAGVAVMGWSQVAVQRARSLADQFAAGQITKQQATASMERIALAQTAAKGEAVKTAAGAGAEFTPVTVTAP